MIINSITLNNYRLYEGKNTISFTHKADANLFLISGENGFGKTTFLHSLIWCLYGRMSIDVDDIVRKEVQKTGYNSILKNNLNFNVLNRLLSQDPEIIDSIRKNGYSPKTSAIKNMAQYSVAIDFAEVIIPVIPCKSLKIVRTYDYIFDTERVEILIDGKRNELTTEIGPDVFINDFILNKDIARFFFFDSEQIVSLAETNTTAEKRRLCSAYNEVLGVRKYEDLKHNIDNLRMKFRRKSKDVAAREKLEGLIAKQTELQETQQSTEELITKNNAEIEELKRVNENLQVRIMREGSSNGRDDISRIQKVIESAKGKNEAYKKELKKYMDYAPLAMTGELLKRTRDQVEHDYRIGEEQLSAEKQNELITNIESEILVLFANLENKAGSQSLQIKVQEILDKHKSVIEQGETLMDFSKEDYEELVAIYSYVTSTYKSEFEHLAEDYRKNKILLDRNSRQLSNIMSKENDEVIKALRTEKNNVENSLIQKENEVRSLHEKLGVISQELATTNKLVAQLSKKVSLEDGDVKKDAVAEQLSNELSVFLVTLKEEKKFSLERRIKTILNNLMHKEDFVGRVEVSIMDEDMDIDLYSSDNKKINRDTLSKGEQQLYATSILKALVDESGIQFPVFIDSPLQKFDKSHASKIITEFYPQVSKQVVLFPLLYKELTKAELDLMLPLVNSAYLIKNDSQHSYFEQVDANKLME